MKNRDSEHVDMVMDTLGVDITNPAERRYAAGLSQFAFNLIYLPHHFSLEPMPEHFALVELLEDDSVQEIGVIGYRGCAKSTYCSLAYPLRANLYKQHHFSLLINETKDQMELNILTMREELESNEMIRADFPIDTFRFTKQSIQFDDALLIGRSRGQKIRGMKFRQYRPSLIIGDDVESLEWTRKKENRDKTERWWLAEVVSAQEEYKCKLFLIGNLLHQDALMSRLKRQNFYRFVDIPFFRPDGVTPRWTAKYPTPQHVERQKQRVKSHITWAREYELKIIAEDEQIITEKDITWYKRAILDERDHDGNLLIRPENGATAHDLAISEKTSADYTAGISGIVAQYGGRKRLFITDVSNEHLSFVATQMVIRRMYEKLPFGSHVVVEDVGYQKAAIQELKRLGLPVRPIRPVSDKRARLESVAGYIKDGTVMFAEEICKELVEQLLGFGVEAHDDLVDALVYLIMVLLTEKQSTAIIGKVNAL